MWSMDFMQDALTDGRAFWTFNVIDDYNREGLWIDQLIDESLEFYGIKTSEDVQELPSRARSHSQLTETQAQKLANKHVRANRSQ